MFLMDPVLSEFFSVKIQAFFRKFLNSVFSLIILYQKYSKAANPVEVGRKISNHPFKL